MAGLAGLLALALAAGCDEVDAPADAVPGKAAGVAPPAPVVGMPDVAAERGLDYVNVSGAPEKPTILDAGGAGVALLDLGGDGDLDVVFAQGVSSLSELVRGARSDLSLFRNDGRARFQRVSGPGLAGWWTGLATGDLDGDGRTDLVAGAYGDLAVLVQDGRGRLVVRDPGRSGLGPWFAARPGARLDDRLARGGAGGPDWFTSLALFDADRDGVLDLYAGRYLELDPVHPPTGTLGTPPLDLPCTWKGHPVYCGPRGFPAQPDALLAGTGDGSFADASARWLPEHEAGYTLGVAPFDADMDGDTDLYVANDSVPNRLFVNELRRDGGAFVERGFGAGVAVNPDGQAEAGMGIAVGDVDRDGLFDLAVTNFSDEPTQLYLGAEVGFACWTYRSGLAHLTRRRLSWGTHLVDLDGDGRLELFVANGHVYPQADLPGTGTSYAQRDDLFRLRPDAAGELEAVPWDLPGSIFDAVRGTRGSAVGDLDGDGAPELVLAYLDGPAGLGLNGLAPESRRLSVRCLGPTGSSRGSGDRPRTPPDGKGTRIVVVPELPPGTPEFALLGEVQSARGYQSASSEWVDFGLGACARYRSVTVLWPSGRVDRLPAGPTQRRLTVREGVGIVDEEALR